jgi:hypothetical protein
MRSSSHGPDRIRVTFDDDHAVANAGLIAPATLAQHLGIRELFDELVDLGAAPGRANVGLKAMTLVHSALSGGDCIDDADRMRVAATPAVLGHGVRAPSTLGTFLRSFTWRVHPVPCRRPRSGRRVAGLGPQTHLLPAVVPCRRVVVHSGSGPSCQTSPVFSLWRSQR